MTQLYNCVAVGVKKESKSCDKYITPRRWLARGVIDAFQSSFDLGRQRDGSRPAS
jgi:hypothetical protein